MFDVYVDKLSRKMFANLFFATNWFSTVILEPPYDFACEILDSIQAYAEFS